MFASSRFHMLAARTQNQPSNALAAAASPGAKTTQVEPEAADGVMLSGGAGTDAVILSALGVGDTEAARCWLRDILFELSDAPSSSSSLAHVHEEAARRAAAPTMVSSTRDLVARVRAQPCSTSAQTRG